MSVREMREMLVKTGTIDLTKVGIDGAVPVSSARALLELVVESTDFMKLVNVQRSDEAKIPVNDFDVDDFVLQNLPEGTEPTNFAAGSNKGKYVQCYPTNAFMELFFSTIRSATGKKAEKIFDAKLAKKVGENIIQVGFVGLSRSETTQLAAEINKGWVKLAKDNGYTNKVDYGPFVDSETGKIGWIDYLTAVTAALPDKYKSKKTCKIMMNPSDHTEYVMELGKKDGNSAIVLSGLADKFDGYDIVEAPFLTSGEVLFGNPKNLLLGLQNKIERYRELKATARKVNYTFIVNPGYEIGCYDALVIGYDVTPGDNPGVPANAPEGVTFTDTDTDTGEIAGTVAITKATSEADVTHYRIYLGKDADKKAVELATLPKSGSNLNFIIPENTVIGDNTNIYVYTVNGVGECVTPATVVITDDTGA